MSPSPHPTVPTIVHIGAFDLASYGDQIFPLVAAHELRQRLGDVELLPFGPVGSTGRDYGVGARSWALGPWTPSRADQIARRATLVLCGGGEFVHCDGEIYAPFYGIDPLDAVDLRMDRWFIEVLGPAEPKCPVVWHAPGVPADLDDDAERVRAAIANRAIVAVRDEQSRDRLEATGTEREIDVVPDSAFLLPHVLPEATLRARRAELRAAGQYPPEGPVIAVQGNGVMTDFVGPLAKALDDVVPEAQLVAVSVSPCHDDGRFADALAAALPDRTWRVPDDSSLEAVAAAISGSDCFLGVSLHAAITAHSYGRPHVTFDPFGHPKLNGLADLLDAERWIARDPTSAAAAVRDRHKAGPVLVDASIGERIGAHFDRIAEICERRLRTTTPEPLTWADTAASLHLSLRRVPRRVDPAPSMLVPGVRRPDIEPTQADLLSSLSEALAIRAVQRAEVASDQHELARLRAENRDLRGALDHLEGTCHHLESTLAQLRAELAATAQARDAARSIVADARASRVFRLTGRPSALDERDQRR